jgi:low temperature requirement protein LtrA
VTQSPAASAPAERHRKYEVTPLELFFDLVFVFAVAQLAHHLLAHVSWRGAAETLVLLLAVFAVWYYTSWAATMIRADESPTRRMVLAVMLLGLFMNAAVSQAFTGSLTSGWAFVVPLLLIQLGRTLWTIVHAPGAVFREHFVRVLLWLLATTPLWIAGALATPGPRLLWWGVAAVVDLIGTWTAHPVPGRRMRSENLAFAGGHLLERCRLFWIVALGETVLTTGTAITAVPLSPMTVLMGTAAMVGAIALWALGFGPTDRLTLRHVEETSNPIRASHLAANALIVMVAGLIAVAVANEMVIAHPYAEAPDSIHAATLPLLLFGGPILVLAAQGWYLWAVLRIPPLLRIAGIAALVVLGVAAATVPPYAALVLAGASLTVLAMLDSR